MNFKGSLLVAS